MSCIYGKRLIFFLRKKRVKQGYTSFLCIPYDICYPYVTPYPYKLQSGRREQEKKKKKKEEMEKENSFG